MRFLIHAYRSGSVWGLLVSLPFLFSSCATLMTGTSDTVRVDSNPSGADIYVDSSFRDTTPAYISLNRKFESREISIRSEEYGTERFQVNPEFNPWVLGNIPIPYVDLIDLLTGSAIRYPETYFKVGFEPGDSFEVPEIRGDDWNGAWTDSSVRFRSSELPEEKDGEASQKDFFGLSYPLIGLDNREIGAMLYYRPFPRVGFELGGGHQSRVPYLISNYGGSGSGLHLLRGQGYELRSGVNFFPKTGLAFRGKRMPRWGFTLVWREFRTDKFCRVHGSNGRNQNQRDIVMDHVDQLKLMVNRGYTWSWGIGGSKLGIFLDTRFGFGLGFNGIRREKFSWGYGGTCGGNAFKEEDPVDRFGYPYPAVKLDLRLGLSTLY